MCFRIDIYLFMIRHTFEKCSLLANCTCLLRRIEWKSKMKVHLHIFKKKKSDNDLKIKDNCWKQGNKWNFNHQCHTTKVLHKLEVLSTFDGAQKYAQKRSQNVSFFQNHTRHQIWILETISKVKRINFGSQLKSKAAHTKNINLFEEQ